MEMRMPAYDPGPSPIAIWSIFGYAASTRSSVMKREALWLRSAFDEFGIKIGFDMHCRLPERGQALRDDHAEQDDHEPQGRCDGKQTCPAEHALATVAPCQALPDALAIGVFGTRAGKRCVGHGYSYCSRYLRTM